MSGRLQNRVCLITGSTGIGAATARLAASEGAPVFVVSRDEESCRALAEEIGCGYHIADLTRSGEVAEAVETFFARHGRIDALFNVAGVSGRKFGDGPVHECSEEGWDVTMETNARSVFLMCRAVVRRMMEQPVSENGLRGTILNMASVLAFSPEPKFFATHAYAASKSAIIGLTQAMAAYYAPSRIRANAIAPALTRTPMSRRAQQNHELLEFIKTKQPLSEDMIEADDVARAAVFLLSDDARNVTGEIMSIDAGWRMS
ncbi:MAG: SDR family oxidoreductase [Blastocatellia bacterium]|nr:SDR family oxidoreductase [Blastocatellia bacterium]